MASVQDVEVSSSLNGIKNKSIVRGDIQGERERLSVLLFAKIVSCASM